MPDTVFCIRGPPCTVVGRPTGYALAWQWLLSRCRIADDDDDAISCLDRRQKPISNAQAHKGRKRETEMLETEKTLSRRIIICGLEVILRRSHYSSNVIGPQVFSCLASRRFIFQ